MYQCFDGGNIQLGAVIKFNSVDGIGSGGITDEIVVYPHLFFSGFGFNQQIVTAADKVEIGGFPTVGKAQGINQVIAIVIVVRHRILSETFAEDVGVGTVAAVQTVVAGSTDQNIISIFSVQIIVAFATQQTVVAFTAVKAVITTTAIQRIIAVVAVQNVVVAVST